LNKKFDLSLFFITIKVTFFFSIFNMLLAVWASLVSFFTDSYDVVSDYFSASTVQEKSVFQGQKQQFVRQQKIRTDIDIQKEPSSTDLPTVVRQTGVARKSSYLGRIREAEHLIEHEYYIEAGIELSLAIEEKPEVLKPFLLLGDIYIRTRNISKLKTLLVDLQQKFPNHPQVHVLAARYLLLHDDFQSVKGLIYAYTGDVPPRLQFYQAALFALQNNHDQAKEILANLKDLEVEPYALKVGSDGVEESYENNNTVPPKLALVVQNMFDRYTEFELLREGKNAHLFALLGKELGNMDETNLVRAFADVAVKEDSSYIDAWILRGYSYFLEKNFELALHDFYQAYRLDSIRPQTHYFLALTLSELGRNNEAISFFEKALEHDFEFSEDVDWKLVELFVKEQHYDRVVEMYRRLLTPDTEEKKISRAIHVLIDKAHRSDVALELTESFIVENFDDVFLLNMYAWALIENDLFEKAEEILEQADNLLPDHPQTYLNFGLLFEAQNDPVDAKAYYKKSYEYGKLTPEFVSLANFAAKKYNALSQ
jgi:tetratricopeptide (TPR) repeat protein